MRVIAGRFKGRCLRTVKGLSTRSTADRVRESLFNILAAELPRADVLDLFCGAGTLGIEALSRGAARATFVDISRRSIQRTRENLRNLGVLKDAELIVSDALRALRAFSREGSCFSLILADPPYGQGWSEKLLQAVAQGGARAPSGILVTEHHKKEPLGKTPAGFSLWTQRRFGDTMFTIWRWQEQEEQPSKPNISTTGES